MTEEQPSGDRAALRIAVKLALGYFLVAAAWILGSDHLVAAIASGPSQLERLQTFKGLGFVVIMTVLVGVSAARLTRAENARERALLFATTDPVTRLPNATALYRTLAGHVDERAAFALLLVDFRDFARINNVLGWQAGDQALYVAGQRLREAAGERALVTRAEGDKFAVLLPDMDAGSAEAAAQRICEAFRPEIRVNGQGFLLEAGVGFAVHPDDGAGVAPLMDAAELALQEAKAPGGDAVRRFSRTLLQSRREQFHLEAELRQALADDALDIHLQPQYRLSDGRLVGAEALARWTHPERGPISPAVFIPVAEQSGLIERISAFVFARACRTLRGWQDARLPGPRIAVNVAGHQLDHGRISFHLQRAADEHGVALSMLEVEITETMAMRDPDRAVELLGQLRALGVTVALDDFGTGYSSLNYLMKLPIDKLKIDRAFISRLEQDHRQCCFTRTLVRLGRDLGLQVVAEGIETEAQRRRLCELECDLGQGFLLGRPMPVDAFTELLARNPADTLAAVS